MKKVLFICLLSLSVSVCFGKPATEEGGNLGPSLSTAAPTTDPQSNQTPIPHETPAITNVTTPANPISTGNNTTIDKAVTTVTPEITSPAVPNIPEKKGDDKKGEKKEDDKKGEKKEDNKKGENAPNVVPAKVEKENATSTVNPSHVTEKFTPTPKPGNATKPTTVAPHKADEQPPLKARGFDGGSFIGGIILTLGLLAIGYMGMKYYKNHTERNYHTL